MAIGSTLFGMGAGAEMIRKASAPVAAAAAQVKPPVIVKKLYHRPKETLTVDAQVVNIAPSPSPAAPMVKKFYHRPEEKVIYDVPMQRPARETVPAPLAYEPPAPVAPTAPVVLPPSPTTSAYDPGFVDAYGGDAYAPASPGGGGGGPPSGGGFGTGGGGGGGGEPADSKALYIGLGVAALAVVALVATRKSGRR